MGMFGFMKSFLLFVVLLGVCLVPGVFAEEFEKSFAERGFEDFVVDGANEFDCFSVSFLNHSEEDLFPILSLQANFLPVVQGNASVLVELNGERVEELKPKDFRCGEECVVRITLPKESLVEENDLNLCFGTGNTITRIVLSNESALGFYLTPVFLEGDFVKSVSKTTLFPEEKIEVKILIHNSGSAPAVLDLNFVKPFLEERLGYIEVIGDTYFSNVELGVDETKEFKHFVKPKKAIQMSLPSALLEYENVFGETEKIHSNIVYLNVEEIEEKLLGRVFAEKNVFRVNEDAVVRIVVSNLSEKDSFNAELILNAPDGIGLGENGEEFEILPKETRSFEFLVSAENVGEYGVGCTLSYGDNESECPEISLVFEEKEEDSLLLAVGFLFVIGIILGAGILFYAYGHRKE